MICLILFVGLINSSDQRSLAVLGTAEADLDANQKVPSQAVIPEARVSFGLLVHLYFKQF
jgi:hypothetical protein